MSASNERADYAERATILNIAGDCLRDARSTSLRTAQTEVDALVETLRERGQDDDDVSRLAFDIADLRNQLERTERLARELEGHAKAEVSS